MLTMIIMYNKRLLLPKKSGYSVLIFFHLLVILVDSNKLSSSSMKSWNKNDTLSSDFLKRSNDNCPRGEQIIVWKDQT